MIFVAYFGQTRFSQGCPTNRIVIALQQEAAFNYVILHKDVYVKYLSYATLGSYVAFPCVVFFARILADDEKKLKLLSARPQNPA